MTNAGGPGVLATDALITGGGELAELSPETMEAYNAVLPATWSHNNPVDILGDASPERYAKALEIAAKDPNSDGMLVILTPQAMTDPTQHRRAAEAARQAGRQAGAGQLDGRRGRGGRRGDSEPRQHSHLPLSRHRRARLQLHVAVQLQPEGRCTKRRPCREDSADWTPDRKLVDEIIAESRGAGRTILTEFESKQVLAAYGIPTAKTVIATDAGRRRRRRPTRSAIPVVLKLYSETITHKTDVGGVQLNLGRRRGGASAPSTPSRRR